VRLALDTNVLAYAEGIERVPEDSAKCAVALRLLGQPGDAAMVVARQTLAELHAVLVRKTRLPPAETSERVREWAAQLELIDTNAAVFEAALGLAGDHGLQIYDSLILAAAVEARCDLLLTEDLQDGFAWRGVVVTNPFGPSPDPRLARLLSSAP
jgi:predicted nucleic acid-binding protein